MLGKRSSFFRNITLTYFRRLSTVPSTSKKLYFDALNYNFLKDDWNCMHGVARAKAFIRAAEKSGWTIKAFIGDTCVSKKAMKTWRQRRTYEIKNGLKGVPQGASILLAEMLTKCGVSVCFPDNSDNLDAIASHAHADGASILSMTNHLFGYTDANFTVYSDFKIVKGSLELVKHKLHKEEGGEAVIVDEKRPVGPPRSLLSVSSHIKNGVYRRGVPTPLVKALGVNPHSVVAPLRHAMYAKLNLSGPIVEEWPEWCAVKNGVKWVVRTDVQPASTPELEELLSNPDKAVKHFFPTECSSPDSSPHRDLKISDKDWRKHVTCVRNIVYELCAASDPAGPSLLDLVLRDERKAFIGAKAAEFKRLSLPKVKTAKKTKKAAVGGGVGAVAQGAKPSHAGRNWKNAWKAKKAWKTLANSIGSASGRSVAGGVDGDCGVGAVAQGSYRAEIF